VTPSRSRPVRIGIVGLGYMGLATGLGFSAHGASVLGYDVKPEIRASVERARAPYREVGLADLLRRERRSGRFRVAADLESLVGGSEGIFLCVATPPRSSGRIDLRPLTRSVRELGAALRSVPGYRVVVVKSTVVPGTTDNVVSPGLLRSSGRRPSDLGVASNPEFLAEGSMVRDALSPERVVVGSHDPRAIAWLRRAYRTFRSPVVALSPSGAELVKYSSNAFLALKVSFANEMSRLTDRLGENVDTVMDAVGRDSRIGPRFLRAGPGFGGSCFEKDLRALVVHARGLGIRLRSAEAALRINDEQLDFVLARIRAAVGRLRGKRIALLGLAFKAGTDDVRETRALPIAEHLVAEGARVRAHDPSALENFRRVWEDHRRGSGGALVLCPSVERALDGADAAILQADWPEYSRWPESWTRRMRHPVLVDLRREIGPASAGRTGLRVFGLGDGSRTPDPAPDEVGRGG
jgi:UDPglucose 6-dehydrogenase